MNTKLSSTQRVQSKIFKKKDVEKKSNFVNENYLLEISSGNNEFIAVFLSNFQRETKQALQKLQSHFSTGDFTAVKRTARALRPTCAFIGADSLCNLAMSLEQAADCMNKAEVRKLITQLQNTVEGVRFEIEEYFNVNFIRA